MANASIPVIQINEGNVGIGTSSPASSYGFSRTLEIQGAANAEINISQSNNGKDWSLGIVNGANYQQTTSGQDYIWLIGGSEKMNIQSTTGNVIIGGYLSPGSSGASYTSLLQLQKGHNTSNEPDIVFKINNLSSALTAGTGGSKIVFEADESGSGNGEGAFRHSIESMYFGGVSNWKIYSGSGFDQLHFATGGSFAMGINQAGNLGVGTTTPAARIEAKSTYDYNVSNNGAKIGRIQYAWYTGQHFANNTAYVHIKTNLWMGGAPGGNTQYIMGGFTAKSYSYSGSGYGEGSCMFHNWSGGFVNLSVTNRGSWATFVQNPYVSTDGYCVIVLRHNYFSTPNIDFHQSFTPYPWRQVSVTVTSVSANNTGVY